MVGRGYSASYDARKKSPSTMVQATGLCFSLIFDEVHMGKF